MAKKKQKPFSWKKIKHLLWPRMGLKRFVQYIKHRVSRLPGTPHMIAGGVATGIALSFTPFVGLHILMGLGLCYLLGFSAVAMIIGTALGGNPWTFPFIWTATYKLGNLFLSGKEVDVDHVHHAMPVDSFSFSVIFEKPFELLLPMTLGSIPFVIVSWIIGFYFFRNLITRYHLVRQNRIYKNRGKK